MEVARDCDGEATGPHGPPSDADQMSQETVESPRKSPPPTPPMDDFLTIVPKPTLLSKEKAKKRLQAFNLTKLNAYYNKKKKAVVPTVAGGSVKAKEIISAKKAVKKPLSPARETVEAIEKCKLEQEELSLQMKIENAKLNRQRVVKRRTEHGQHGGEVVKREPNAFDVRKEKEQRRHDLSRRSPGPGKNIRDRVREHDLDRDRVRGKNKQRNSLRGARRELHKVERNEIREEHYKEVLHHREEPRDRYKEQREQHSNRELKHRRKSPVKEIEQKPKEKTTWSDYDECFYNDHQEEREIRQEVDVRKMLLFNSVSYNLRPFTYYKVDGVTLANVSVQFLRYTVKSSPRLVYSPNPCCVKGMYFQRDEVFSIISKPQKESVLNLINQAAESKPIAPSKPLKARAWYPSKKQLVELHADEPLHYDTADLEDVLAEEGTVPVEKPKKKKSKRRTERGDKRKRRKKAKAKRAEKAEQMEKLPEEKISENSPETRAEVATTDAKQRKRTDSHKSDTNSINSIDNALNNHVSSRTQDEEQHLKITAKQLEPEDPKTPPLRLSALEPITPKTPISPILITPKKTKVRNTTSTTSSSERAKTSTSSRGEHAHKNHLNYHAHDLLDGKPPKVELKDHVIVQNCKIELPAFHKDHHDIKSYSKKPQMMSACPKLATPTKIYKIKNDCLEKLDTTPVLYNMVHNAVQSTNDHKDHKEVMPEVRADPVTVTVKNEEKIESKPKVSIQTQLRNRFEAMGEFSDTRSKKKESPMEKLKTKPSELYSPTLQSLPSDSSSSDTEMPDTNEYKSHWESEEELHMLRQGRGMDTSWESDDDSTPLVLPRAVIKSKGLDERSLEMPLNINITRQRSQSKPKPMHEIKLFEDLDGSASWDIDIKQTSFELNPDVNSFSLSSGKPNLEDEYMQFMSSVSTIEESTNIKPEYSSSSSSSSSSCSSSSTESVSSFGDDKERTGALCLSNEVVPAVVDADEKDLDLPLMQVSPVCNVDSTSSPAIPQDEKEYKLQMSRKPLPAIVLAKKSPLVGCNLFKDEDSDNETTERGNQAPIDSKMDASKPEAKVSPSGSRRQSPSVKREILSPKRSSRPGSPNSVRHYNRNRRRSPPKRDASPRRDLSPRSRDRDRDRDRDRRDDPKRAPSPKRAGSPRKTSPRRNLSPRRPASPRRNGSPRRGGSPSRRAPSPRRGASPRKITSPRRTGSPRRFSSPRLGSPKRTASPKPRDSRDNSPRHKESDKKPLLLDGRRREGSPLRHNRLSPPRRRSPPKHRDGSRSPKHDQHSRSDKSPPRSMIDLARHRDYDREKHELQRNRDERYRDRKYRDGSPRYRESPSRYSPSRRRSSPRHRYSPKRDRSPRYRERSPRRRSLSPPRRIYSRSSSKERKHESIAQALHRLAGMEYDPPKSPGPVNSPMEGYIRVADSTISDEQLLQNCGGEFNSTQSPVYFNPPFKAAEGSPKRIPLDDRINQVLGIDAAKQANAYPSDNYYNQMYYEQYGGSVSANNAQIEQNYKQYNPHLVAVNSVANKVLQVGNVLQVVPTEPHQPIVAIKKETNLLTDALLPDIAQKFVSVGNMLEIVPSTDLPSELEPVVAATVEIHETKLADDLLKARMAERKAEREKRRLERDRRRKDKEVKRKEREQRRQLKFKAKSEATIKKALIYEAIEESQEDEQKLSAVPLDPSGSKVPKGILVVRQRGPPGDRELPIIPKHKKGKGVKFADGVLPGEGTSPSGGEDLSSPPPFSKVPKEKRYTKTKKPKKTKVHKKKIKVKIIRAKTKKAGDKEEDRPPSPPPGSPPPHIFPPRIKPTTLIAPAFFANYSFNPLNCTPFPPDASHPPFPGIPNMQFPPILHLPPGQPPPIAALHPIPILLPPPPVASRLVVKPPSKPIDKGM